MNIGDYEIVSIEAGRFALDGGAMFGIIPRPLWSRTNPPDDQNRIDLALRLLLLKSNDRCILIDTGVGTKWSEKEAGIYKVDHSAHALDRSLAAHGVTPGDVTDVLLTHLHFDHAGGATTRVGDEVRPTFPAARYHVQKANLEWGSRPTERDRGSYLARDFQPLADAGCLELVDGERELFPGVFLEVMHGHTFSQQLVRITDDRETIFFCADLFPTTSHLGLPYIMGYDLQPLQTLAEKKRILPRALEEDWILFFEHDPVTEAARVTEGKRGVEVGEKRRICDL